MSGHTSPAGERLCRSDRLCCSAQYLRCYRRGQRRHGSLLTLHAHPNSASSARLGITASRKVGNAVARHRLKRRVREIFRRWPRRSVLPSVDFVVHLKPAAGASEFADFKVQLEKLLATFLPQDRGLPNRSVQKRGATRARQRQEAAVAGPMSNSGSHS